jgi:hypothetical protein
MRTRDAVIEYQKTLDDTGTLIKDLSIKDPISALYLEFEATNGTTSNKGNFISDVITKIELVSGSTVLYGVNLSQLEVLHLCKLGKMPTMFPSEWASGIQRHGCLLMFGRRLWDRDYAMDLTKYPNPQLKITSNLSAVRAVAADTAFATGTLKGTIVAKVMEDVAAPGKYLRAKEIDSFTSAASGDKRVELVYDYPYRLLLLRAYISESDINEVITDFKLTCDTDAFIPFNRKVQQLDAEALALFGTGRLKHDIFCSHQDTVRLLFNKEPDVRPFYQSSTTPSIVGIDWQWSSAMKLNIYDHAGSADTTDRKYTMVEEGHALHATLPVPFGEMDKPDSWFNPKPFSKIEAVLTQAVASAVCQVVLEQEVPVGV